MASCWSLKTVQVLLLLSAVEHTSGAESFLTVTVGWVRALIANTSLSLMSPQPDRPGVSVAVAMPMLKSCQEPAPL